MAQDSDSDNYMVVDNVFINPSPQRVRNILTLQERVEVIKAYDQQPMYTKVARMFNCSWEQIKNIITNRDAIMEFCMATKYQKKPEIDSQEELHMDLRQRKIKFLGECVWECLQRIQFHSNLPINEELIRVKALEFQDLLKLEDFVPNKQWLNLFKATHNISLSNKKISVHRTPMPSMDLKDIMTYCTKLRATKTSNTLLLRYSSYDVNTMESEGKRLRKLKFLEKVLGEYLLRAKFHNSMRLDDYALRRVALEFNEILKVQDFDPSLTWIQDFTKSQLNQETISNIKRPPLSLDLKDIISYCSRTDNKAKATTITLAPKETSLQMRVLPKYQNSADMVQSLYQKRKSIIYLDDAEDKDVKPDIEEIQVEKQRWEQKPLPLKIRKIESINNDPELQRKLQTTIIQPSTPTTISIKKIYKYPPKEPSKEPVFIRKIIKAPTPISKDSLQTENIQIQIKEEEESEVNFILPTTTIQAPTTQTTQQNSPLSPENNSNSYEHSSDDGMEELPRHVNSFRDVLLLLKPLEEYAMLKENYRAIGLITQLEDVLKNPPEENHTEEEFIG